VKRGHESRMCETEMGTLQEEHRGGSDRDMRYEWVRRVWPMLTRARAVSQRLFFLWKEVDQEEIVGFIECNLLVVRLVQ